MFLDLDFLKQNLEFEYCEKRKKIIKKKNFVKRTELINFWDRY